MFNAAAGEEKLLAILDIKKTSFSPQTEASYKSFRNSKQSTSETKASRLQLDLKIVNTVCTMLFCGAY